MTRAIDFYSRQTVTELYTQEVIRRERMKRYIECEVCGESILEKDAVEYQPERNVYWWFCSDECLDTFKKERPEKGEKNAET